MRVLGLIGVLLLLLSGATDAVTGGRCLHHGYGGRHHDTTAPHHAAPGDARQHDGKHANGHAADKSPASPTHHSNDCAFTCIAVAGVPTVHAPAATYARVPLLIETRQSPPKDCGSALRTSSLPFFLPYSNGPPSLS